MNKKEIINKKIIISNRNLKKITRPSGVKFRADTSISNNRSTVRANNQALIFISAIANNIYRMKSNIEKFKLYDPHTMMPSGITILEKGAADDEQ